MKGKYTLKPDELCHDGPDFHIAKETSLPGQMYVPKAVNNCMNWAGEHESGQPYPPKGKADTEKGEHRFGHKGMHKKKHQGSEAASEHGPRMYHSGKSHSSY